LEILQHHFFLLQPIAYVTIDDLSWIYLKKLKLSRLYLYNFDGGNYRNFFRINSSEITSMYFGELNSECLHWKNLVKIINSCPKLNQLSVLNGASCLTNKAIRHIDVNILSNLSLLHLSQFEIIAGGFSNKSTFYLANNCNKLISVEYRILQENLATAFNEQNAILLVQNNPHLKTILFMGCEITHVFTDLIVQRLPMIKTLTIFNNLVELSILDAIHLLTHCKLLITLKFSFSQRFNEKFSYHISQNGTKLCFGDFYNNVRRHIHQVEFDSLLLCISNKIDHFLFNRHLDLNITTMLMSLYRYNPYLRIFSIIISECKFFGEENLTFILTNFKQLIKISIIYDDNYYELLDNYEYNSTNKLINNEMFSRVFSTVPNQLLSLTIGNHGDISTETIIYLISTITKLQILKCYNCFKVDRSIVVDYVTNKCKTRSITLWEETQNLRVDERDVSSLNSDANYEI
jgi:hypothetical protein